MNSHSTLLLPNGRTLSAAWRIERGLRHSWDMYRWQGEPVGGLHVYSRQGAGFVTGTVRFSNAAVRKDGTGFCGAFYFDEASIFAPRGYEWITLPTFGQRVSGSQWVLIPRLEAGKQHFARPHMTLEWTFALVQVGASREIRAAAIRALKFEDLDIPDPVTTWCGPTATKLPSVSRKAYQAEYAGYGLRLLDAQERGLPCAIQNIAEILQPPVGGHWWNGERTDFAYGGSRIDPTSIMFEQCPAGVLVHSILHRANMARSFCAAFDRDTGRPIALEDWTTDPTWNLMKGEPGLEGENELSAFLIGDYSTYRYRRFNVGYCPYEADLWTVKTNNTAHSIRSVRDGLRPAEFVHDECVIDDLVMFAEYNRASFFNNRLDAATPDRYPNRGYYQTSLATMLEAASKNPNKGAWIDRNWAWAAFSGAVVLTYAGDVVSRRNWVRWGRDMMALAAIAADKFGIRGRYSAAGYLPENVQGIQTFHEMLVMIHALALGRMVLTPTEFDAVIATNRKALTDILSFPARPYYGSVGPPHWIGTAENGVDLPALDLAHTYKDGDPAHVWAACAQTYLADPSAGAHVLELALPHWAPHPSLDARLEYARAMFPDKSWSGDMQVALESRA